MKNYSVLAKLIKIVNRFKSNTKKTLPGFDREYYLFWYPDVHMSKLDPLQHYITHGWKEGRDPSAGFSTNGYLAANSDVASSGINPLIHFLRNGLSEGRTGYLKIKTAPAPYNTRN